MVYPLFCMLRFMKQTSSVDFQKELLGQEAQDMYR